MASQAQGFHGLPAPEGVERKILYASEFRAIYTYKMSLPELDAQLQKLLSDNWATRVDQRSNLTGKLDVASADGRIVHVSTEPCSNPMFCTMKYWVDM
jgi:hypothetical protein